MTRRRYKMVYVEGRGYFDIAKTVMEKLLPAANTLTTVALTKAAEVGGDKLGAFVANKVADKVLKPNNAAIKAIEDIENKIKGDINSYTGKGFKLIF